MRNLEIWGLNMPYTVEIIQQKGDCTVYIELQQKFKPHYTQTIVKMVITICTRQDTHLCVNISQPLFRTYSQVLKDESVQQNESLLLIEFVEEVKVMFRHLM